MRDAANSVQSMTEAWNTYTFYFLFNFHVWHFLQLTAYIAGRISPWLLSYTLWTHVHAGSGTGVSFSYDVTTFLQRATKLALQALYMLRQIHPSVRPSVTLRYCVKTRKRRRMRSSPSGSPVSSFLMPRMVDGGRPCSGKIWVQRGRSPANSETAVETVKCRMH